MQTSPPAPSLTILIPILDSGSALHDALIDVAGLPLIRRVALMAEKAGFNHVLLVSEVSDPVFSPLPDDEIQHLQFNELRQQSCPGSILLLSPDCLPDAAFFNHLDNKQVNSDETLLWSDKQAILLGEGCLETLRASLIQTTSFPLLIEHLCQSADIHAITRMNESVGLYIDNANACRRAENTLLSGLVKTTEGWMALHINRKISLAVTRRLMRTSVTPNHMTGVSMVLGMIGAACFLSPTQGMQILGAIFFLLHSILDGCDGELARLKFMESRLGGILDFWSDNIVHVSIFAAMGVGWAAASPDSWWPWVCAALAVAGTAVSASLVYFHTMHAEGKSGPLYTSVSTSRQKSAIVRIADMLSRRDFIYLVLVLALLGQTHWFLIMTAIGAPIYTLLLMAIMLRD